VAEEVRVRAWLQPETRFSILLSFRAELDHSLASDQAESRNLLFLEDSRFLTAKAVRNDNVESREAAQECSPGRKPWVGPSS
jgi:hypothetical protein